MHNVKIEDHIHSQGHNQDCQRNQSKPIDLFADRFQIIDEFVLFKGSGFSGIADLLQLIFNAFQRRVLLQDSIAQIPILLLQRSQIVFEGLDIHGWRRRGHVLVRGQYIRHGSSDVSVQ